MFSRKQNAPEDGRVAITVSEKAFLYVRINIPSIPFRIVSVMIFARERVDEAVCNIHDYISEAFRCDFKLELIVAVARSIVSHSLSGAGITLLKTVPLCEIDSLQNMF